MYGIIQSLIIVPNRRRIGLVDVLNKYCVGGKSAMGKGWQRFVFYILSNRAIIIAT
jgi:hypothetical protein